MLDQTINQDPLEDRMPWPADWSERYDPADADACARLWQAVLANCLRGAVGDLLRPGKAMRGANWTPPPIHGGWIGGRDFHMVCALAGLDGAATVAAIEAARPTPGALEALEQRLIHACRWSCMGPGPQGAATERGAA